MFSIVLFGSCGEKGCTHFQAVNYNADATKDDGSCILIGDTYQGGIIFYLDGNGGGLIAAPVDQSAEAVWGCSSMFIGVDDAAIGAGAQNSIEINSNPNCPEWNAADICVNLTLGGYSDWFLPSKNELNEMYKNIAEIGGFAGVYYWSSTEHDSDGAWLQSLTTGVQGSPGKYNTENVRAVRAF